MTTAEECPPYILADTTNPEVVRRIESGEVITVVDFLPTLKPRNANIARHVIHGLEVHAARCASGRFAGFSLAGTARIHAVCKDMADLIRAADEIEGMWNLRRFARFTITVLAVTDLSHETFPVPEEEIDAVIVGMEDEFKRAQSLFVARKEELASRPPPVLFEDTQAFMVSTTGETPIR